MRYRVLSIVLLVVLAGCSGGTPPSATTTPTDNADLPTTSTEQPATTTETAPPTSRTTVVTTTEPPNNPWQSETVTVAVEHWNTSGVPALYLDSVRNATQYWNQAYQNYSEFEDIHFEVEPNATSPDITVSIASTVEYCGGTVNETFVGCADIHDSGDVVYGESSVEIEAGYTPQSTNETMRHEFGHLLGLEHGMEPTSLMAATHETVALSEPNATERAYPWLTTNLTVAITGSPSETQRDQIHHALAYYEDGAGGLLTEQRPDFTVVRDSDSADIVIDVARNSWACGQQYEGGSCGELFGYNEDVDGALEYYSAATITLAATDDETTAWHVAYWLAYDFGATADEIPEPLDREDDDPRSAWWN